MRDLFCGCESFRDAVDDKDARGTTEMGRVGRHESDRTGAKDGDSLTRLEIRESEAVPTGRKNIGEECEGGLMCVTLGKGKGVEIGKGNTEVLRL